MKKTFKYKAKGNVLGNYWGGGQGSYPTINFEANTIDVLNTKINEALKDGSIDSGMGYESLIGAMMVIEIIETITIDNKEYNNSAFETKSYGELEEEEYNFLFECNLF